MRRLQLPWAAFAACAFVFASLPVQAEQGVTDGEIAFGSCITLTGENRNAGNDYRSGAKAYFDYVNKEKGGVHGRAIRWIVEDDAFDPEKAIDCFNHILSQGVFAAGLSIGSPTGAKYVVMAEARRVPFVANMGGPSFMYDNRRYVFAIRAPSSAEVQGEIDHLWNDLHLRKIAIIYQNDAQGSSALRSGEDALIQLKSSPAVVASFDLKTDNLADAYKRLKSANPEAVLFSGFASRMAKLLQLARADRWDPIFLAVTLRETRLIDAAGDAAEGVVVTNTLPPADQTQLPTIALYRRLLRKYAPKAELGNLSEQGFVDAMLIVEGLRRSGKAPTREGFVAAMESLSDLDAGLGPEYRVLLGPGRHQAFDHISFSVVRGRKAVALTDWSRQLGRSSNP